MVLSETATTTAAAAATNNQMRAVPTCIPLGLWLYHVLSMALAYCVAMESATASDVVGMAGLLLLLVVLV